MRHFVVATRTKPELAHNKHCSHSVTPWWHAIRES